MFLLVILFGIYPIIKSIQMSFTASGTSLSSKPEYIFFSNYVSIFKDPYFLDSLRITLLFTIFSVPLNIMVAFLLALILGSPILKKGSVFFKLSVFLPVVVPSMAAAVVWKWLYNVNFGPISAICNYLGLPEFSGLANVHTVLPSLGAVELWKHVGLYTVIFVTNLQLIDKEMYEAAFLEGANYLQRTLLITIPELSPAFKLNIVYATIQFLKTFTVSLVMTQGGPNFASNFVSYYAYSKFKLANYGEATAMGTVLFVLVILISLSAKKILSMERSTRGTI